MDGIISTNVLISDNIWVTSERSLKIFKLRFRVIFLVLILRSFVLVEKIEFLKSHSKPNCHHIEPNSLFYLGLEYFT